MAKPISPSQFGFSMIEVLVTLMITLIGLLGLAGLMIQAHGAELESYQRAQALILMQDMMDRIEINRNVPSCYAITTNVSTGAPYLGTGSSVTATCSAGTPSQQTKAIADIAAWDNALKGSTESLGGASVGAMVGARGCIVQEDAANKIYRVSVAWQGKLKTIDPTTVAPVTINANLTCGKGLYGDERQRRIVSAALRIGTLN